MFRYSIIIPHYNRIKKLTDLIKTIPDRSDIQLIIVDDNTFEHFDEFESAVSEVINEYSRTTVELYCNPGNRSGGACRNVGLDHAKGKWLIFADSDDVFTDNAFEITDRYADSESDIIFFTPRSHFEDTNETGTRHVLCARYIREYEAGHRKYEYALRYKWYYPWSKMFRREFQISENIRFDETIVSNDVMFSVRSGYAAGQFEVCDDAIYDSAQHRSGGGSLTEKVSKEHFLIRFDVHVDKSVFLQERLSRKLIRYANGTTGWWFVRAIKAGYGFDTVKYMWKKYRKNRILICFSLRDVIDRSFGKIV